MVGMKKRIKRRAGSKAPAVPKGNRKRSFPDLTGDGKVTRKDILKGRGVKLGKGGGKDAAGKNPADKKSAMMAKLKNVKRDKKMGGGSMKKRVKAMGGGAMKKRVKAMGGGAMKKRAKAMGGGMMKKRMKRGGKVGN